MLTALVSGIETISKRFTVWLLLVIATKGRQHGEVTRQGTRHISGDDAEDAEDDAAE